MTRFHHDFEGYSEVNLLKEGASRYTRHSSTKILMLAYAFDDGPIRQWLPAEGEPMPSEVWDAVLDPDVTKIAWNSSFERMAWKNVLGIDIPICEWRDPMVMAHYCSFPGALLKVGEILKLGPDYLKKDGTRLINWFCKPRPATKTRSARRVMPLEKSDLWEDFKEYNRIDVASERKIYRMLKPYDLPEHEWENWFLDQEVNDRGLPINVRMCHNAIKIRNVLVGEMIEEMKEISGLDNPNSNDQLLGWLRSRGYPYYDLRKGHIKSAWNDLQRDDHADWAWTRKVSDREDFERILQLRQRVSRTSVKKFDAVARHVDRDGRIRHSLQFMGAGRTGRFAGRAGYQPQNLTKPMPGLDGIVWGLTEAGHRYVLGGMQTEIAELVEVLNAAAFDILLDEPIDALSGAVRPVLQAPPGWLLIDVDLKAIENVVLGWLANDRKILDPFIANRDPYVDFGVHVYRTPYEKLYSEYEAGDKKRRNICKPAVLGCGYGLGAGKQWINDETGEMEATGLIDYARGMGVDMTPEMSARCVEVWRETYKVAVNYWRELEFAAFRALRTNQLVEANRICSFDVKGPFLRMRLPSGRHLHYCRPKLEMDMKPWGKEQLTLTYEGLNDRYQWRRISTHKGKVTENGDQAVARDLLDGGDAPGRLSAECQSSFTSMIR